MAELMKEEKKVFPKEPMDKELLLSSLRDYNVDGVPLGVEKVITPRLNMYGKVTINAILTVLNMAKGRRYVLDDDGQYTYYVDDKTGEERRDIEVADCSLCTVFFPFYAVPQGDGELDENTTLLITPGTSSYSFFREAYISAEELPADMGEQAFSTNFAEMKEVLDGFTFTGKYALGGSKRKFAYLKCERMEEEI